jgi:hypothetical protein
MNANIDAIFQKLSPDEGGFFQNLHTYLGKYGGFISDGTLNNYFTRKLSDAERHVLAEFFGLVQCRRPDGKLQWNGDLQTDQSVETRTRRISDCCCPIHGIPFYQESTWGHIYDDGKFREGQDMPTCPHCPHCATKAERPSFCIGFCLVCPVRAFMNSDWVVDCLLPEFLHLLKAETAASAA